MVDSNREPIIKDSNYLNAEIIVLQQEDQYIYIVVQDEEPDLLTYTWTLSLDGIIPDAESFPDGRSQVRLSNDIDLDGQVLKVVVSDGSYFTDMSWDLEVVP
ncbi:MAG: hypothetical protein H6739_04300 [Alphaproteobacteria bacterium]|nr:hypothetical protein [Alphaproteobacteria bacterium]